MAQTATPEHHTGNQTLAFGRRHGRGRGHRGLLLLWSVLLAAWACTVVVEQVHAQTPIRMDDVPAWSDDTSRNSLTIAWGDLDNDGDLDLVTGTLDQDTRVLVNVDGEMRLTILPGTDRAADVALGDLNRDNRLDLVVAGGLTDFCNLEQDNCMAQDVVFMNETEHAGDVVLRRLDADDPFDGAAGESAAVVVADLNGDAWLDVVFGGRDGLRVYRNGGREQLALARLPRNGFCADSADPTPAMGAITALAAGDYDGDGDPDLAAALVVPASVRAAQPAVALPPDGVLVLANDSLAGCFRLAQTFPVVGRVSDLAWGDMSGDGLPELAVARAFASVQVWHNLDRRLIDDCGAADALCWDSATQDDTTAVAWGDADSDGDLDLAVANRDTGPNVVYANADGRLLDAPTWADGLSHVTSDVQWGDFDNDGDLDLAAAVYAEPDFVYANDSVPLDAEPAMWFGQGWEQVIYPDGALDWHGLIAQSVALGDVDRDGDLDLAVGYVRYQPCYGRPGFTVHVMQSAGETCWAGASDALYLNERGFFNAAPTWQSEPTVPTVAVAWGDVDADGTLDLVTAGIDGPLALHRNRGSALESSPSCTAADGVADASVAPGRITSMALADVDQDGYLDVVLGLFFGENRIYRFDAAQACFVRTDWRPTLDDTPLVADATYSVAWGDVDNDGDLDLAVGNALNQPSDTAGNRNFLFLNQRGVLDNEPSQVIGQLVDATHQILGHPTRSLAWGDMDGDGDLDLAEGVWSGQKRVYRNDGGFLAAEPAWISADNDLTPALTWVDIDSDGDMDLAAANVTLFKGTSNDLYLNRGGMLGATPAWQSTKLDQTLSVAWGDVDLDGTPDLVFGNQLAQVQVHRGRRAGTGNWPTEARMRPGLTAAPVTTASGGLSTLLAPADAFSVPHVRAADVISIPFTLADGFGGRFLRVHAEYSANGAAWLPAQAAHMPADSAPCAYGSGEHLYPWLVSPPRGEALMGQSSAVRVRLSAVRCLLPLPYEVAGSYAWATLSTQTYPFAVRGRQVRVVDETGAPRADALVFARGAQEQEAARLADASGLPYQTDANGYLQGFGRLRVGDQLAAIWPSQFITTPFQARLFFSSASVTAEGLDFSSVVSARGVQTLTVSPARPLVVFDLDISLEWDARNDVQFMRELESAVKNASAVLFDVTNGQVALGEIHVYHDKEFWDQAHIVIYAANNVRPRATQGGIVDQPVSDQVLTPDGRPRLVVDAYNTGQVRMGPLWDPFGQSQAELSTDWWRALAHELGHYLLFLNDNYLGVSEDGPVRTIANVNCRGSLMTNAYDARNYDEFVGDDAWARDADCLRSLAEVTTGRSDWATITTFLAPWLQAPAGAPVCPGDANCGPESLPLAVTEVCWVLPGTAGQWMTCGTPQEATGGAQLIGARRYDIRDVNGDLLPLYQAQAYLYRMAPGATPDAGDEVADVISLGSTGNLRDSLVVRGARRNDRVCVFAATPMARAGCVDVDPDTNSVELAPVTDWAPRVTVDPVAGSTVLSVTVAISPPPASGDLWAQVYPQYAGVPVTVLDEPATDPSATGDPAASNSVPTRTVIDKVRLTPAGLDADGRTRYVGLVEPKYLAAEGLVRIWVVEEAVSADVSPAPREVFAQYYLTTEWLTSLPGNARATSPGNARATSPGNARATSPGNARATSPGNARATSPGNARATSPGNARATSPGNARATSPGNARALTAGDRALGAPVASGDGQVSIYNLDDLFGSTNVLALHALTSLPDAPSWFTTVGKSYRLVMDEDVRAAIAFSYLQRDVPAGYEHALRVYYRADTPGSPWQPLTTLLDQDENLAVAELPADNRGNGTYALIATAELPALTPGWNALSYPVAGANTVAAALASLEGHYSILYRFDGDAAPSWTQYDPAVVVAYPDFAPLVNTLTHMEFGQTFLISVTAPLSVRGPLSVSVPIVPRLPIDVTLGNDEPSETGAVTGAVTGAMATGPFSSTLAIPPPALIFGSVAAGQLPDARAGDVLAATVDGVRCGGTTLVAGPEGAVIYALHVDSAAVRPQCGVTGSIVSLELDGRVVATTRWENGRAQFVELGAVIAGALPPSRAGEGENRQHFPRTER